MTKQSRPMPSRWLFFALGVGSLIAAGIYLGVAKAQGFPTKPVLRAVMFVLLGIFWVLMYGEGKKRLGSPPSHPEEIDGGKKTSLDG